jgi:dihydropteroate synthase
MRWQARQFEFVFPRPTLVMGIVNVTPDSFFDGGQFLEPGAAIAHALALVKQGADLLDVGGESSRPFAVPVPEAEEKRRVIPVIHALANQVQVPISIDTQKPKVARAALEAGACVVNDIAANRADDAMGRLVAETGAGYVVMHMQGTPQTMQLNPHYDNVTAEVQGFFANRLAGLAKLGVTSDQVVLDVGIGFGKTPDHNLELLASLKRFTSFARPLLLGVSRKSFISRVLSVDEEERLSGSLAATCWAVGTGINVIRTHDVAETRQAVRMIEAIQSRQKNELESAQ